MALRVGVSDIFLMGKLGFWVWGKKTAEVQHASRPISEARAVDLGLLMLTLTTC